MLGCAVALEIVNSIFERNPPEELPKEEEPEDREETKRQAIEKNAKDRMQVQADGILKDLLAGNRLQLGKEEGNDGLRRI